MRTSDYATAAAQLDDHVATCESCSTGHACAEGDDYAEAEYRAYARMRRDDNTGERVRSDAR
jgi:hypothetical protein